MIFRTAGAVVLAALGALLLGASPSQAPGHPPAMAELMGASNEAIAAFVATRMEAGFLMDQLSIPGTRFLGRVPAADLDPGLRALLEQAGPGRPVRVPQPSRGMILVAQLVPQLPAILGGVEFQQESGRMGSKPAVNPTAAQLLGLDVPVDGNDLAAVCDVKTRLIAGEIEAARAAADALPATAPLQDLVNAYGRLSGALAFTSDMAGAIKALEVIEARLQKEPPSAAQATKLGTAMEALGILQLRRGELDNCLMHHNAQMCIFPLSPKAVHTTGDGSRRAVEYFTRALERDPDNYELRWVLNAAAMTVGAHPNGVPERWRIGPQAFRSAERVPHFVDVAGPAGLAARPDNAGGSIADDFDGDGLLDLVVSSRDPCEPLRLFRNKGDGTFEDVSERAGLLGQLGGLNITQTDYDNDGRLDVFVMRGGWETPIRNSLLHNNGDGTFSDVTAAAGLAGAVHRTHTAAWADFDNDGLLDLFVGHEMSFSQLFRNRGDGTFEDVTVRAGMRFRSLTKGAAWGDIDNDGLPDLYVSNFGERNLLFHNKGDGRFEEVALERGVSEPYYSFATWFFDYDNDGWQDLLVLTDVPTVEEQAREYLGLPPNGETLAVYHNRGDGTFENATKALGLDKAIPTMGSNFGDIDNDGFLDFYLGTGAPSYAILIPNRLFRNQAGRHFVDVTESSGTGHLQKGHGVSFADFDNDGDEDIFSNMGGAYLGDKYPDALFENPGNGNNWIGLRLVGTRTNRAAIGARIRVVLDRDENGHEGQRVRWVTSGGSFGSSPLMQHVGLGPRTRARRVEIDWPVSHTRQVVEGLPVDRIVEIVEGKQGFRLLERKAFALGEPATAR
jgi:hypothetical protein